MTTNRIFLIPAFGTNEQLFDGVHIPNHELVPINYLTPLGNEDIRTYGRKLIDTYHITSDDILLGVSFGGIMAVEIAKILGNPKLYLVSSIKETKEKPALFSLLVRTKAYHLISPNIMKKGLFMVKPFFGLNKKGYARFRDNFKKQDDAFLKWGIREALYWENEHIPDNITHIHGSRDPLFPIRNIKQPVVIPNGTHSMMRDKMNEVLEVVQMDLNDIPD